MPKKTFLIQLVPVTLWQNSGPEAPMNYRLHHSKEAQTSTNLSLCPAQDPVFAHL